MEKHFKWFGLIMLSALFLCFASSCKKNDATNSDELDGFKYQNNYVRVSTVFGHYNGGNLKPGGEYSGWNIIGGSFRMTDYDVTTGQDPDNRLGKRVFQTMDKDKQFLFECGRHKSKEVAQTFNRRCPPAHNTFNHEAGELNFWVSGTLTLNFASGKTYTFPDTYFAQGSSGATNNWWFGNDEMLNASKQIIAFNPYFKTWTVPIPLGKKGYGLLSPEEDSNVLLLFERGDAAIPNDKNRIALVGVYFMSDSE